MKGTACFTIYVVENSKYKSASVVVNVTVSPADLELNVNRSEISILVGDVYDVSKNVTVNPVVDLSYVLNSTDIINITASGVVTALKEGMVNVTVVAEVWLMLLLLLVMIFIMLKNQLI